MLMHPQHALGSGGFAAQERLRHLTGGDPDAGGGAAAASLPLLAAGSPPLGIPDAGGGAAAASLPLLAAGNPPLGVSGIASPPLTASSTACGAASSADSDSRRYMCVCLYVCSTC
jgi:hypothetical protein